MTRYQLLKKVMAYKIEPIVEFPCTECVVRPACFLYNNSSLENLEKVFNEKEGRVLSFYYSEMSKYKEQPCSHIDYWMAYRNMVAIQKVKGYRINSAKIERHLSHYLKGKKRLSF